MIDNWNLSNFSRKFLEYADNFSNKFKYRPTLIISNTLLILKKPYVRPNKTNFTNLSKHHTRGIIILETTFHGTALSRRKIVDRMQLIRSITEEFQQHYVFQDGLRFNFLFGLYSQKLEHLLNEADQIDDRQFHDNLNILRRSVEEMSPYVIE